MKQPGIPAFVGKAVGVLSLCLLVPTLFIVVVFATRLMVAGTMLVGVAAIVWHPRRSPVLALGGIVIVALTVRQRVYQQHELGGSVESHTWGELEVAPLHPAAIVPEVDQLLLGTALVPFVDPFIDRAKASRVRRLVHDAYGEADVTSVPSVMQLAYHDFLGFDPAQSGHSFVAVPAAALEPVPVVVFLHGFAGSFQVYTQIWMQLGNEIGFAVVSPSFGCGQWSRDPDALVVNDVLTMIEDDPRLDGSRVAIIGLSNGGMGVSRAVARNKGRMALVGLVSPVLEAEQLPGLAAGAGSAQVIVVSGGSDLRIPPEYVLKRVAALTQRGADVHPLIVPEEDHFLLFSRPEVVFSAFRGPLVEAFELD